MRGCSPMLCVTGGAMGGYSPMLCVTLNPSVTLLWGRGWVLEVL